MSSAWSVQKLCSLSNMPFSFQSSDGAVMTGLPVDGAVLGEVEHLQALLQLGDEAHACSPLSNAVPGAFPVDISIITHPD